MEIKMRMRTCAAITSKVNPSHSLWEMTQRVAFRLAGFYMYVCVCWCVCWCVCVCLCLPLIRKSAKMLTKQMDTWHIVKFTNANQMLNKLDASNKYVITGHKYALSKCVWKGQRRREGSWRMAKREKEKEGARHTFMSFGLFVVDFFKRIV